MFNCEIHDTLRRDASTDDKVLSLYVGKKTAKKKTSG